MALRRSSLFVFFVIACLALSTLTEANRIKKQLHCNKCKKSMGEWKSKDKTIDEQELLDNLLTICDGSDSSDDESLRDKNKVSFSLRSNSF